MDFYRPCKMAACGQVINQDFKGTPVGCQIITFCLHANHPVLLGNVEPAVIEINSMRVVEPVDKCYYFVCLFIAVPVGERYDPSLTRNCHEQNIIFKEHHP